jgi:hypothetical protein
MHLTTGSIRKIGMHLDWHSHGVAMAQYLLLGVGEGRITTSLEDKPLARTQQRQKGWSNQPTR